jgi:hypothetical protein
MLPYIMRHIAGQYKHLRTLAESEVKLAWGEVSNDGYNISLYYSEIGSNATYAAGFSASRQIFRDLGDPATLANGIVGEFRPVSCGGSCAPANLWWEQNGVLYNIQLKLSNTQDEREQQKILVELANSSVAVP